MIVYHNHVFRAEILERDSARLDDDVAGVGIAQADTQYQAVNGLAEWKDQGPREDLRALFSLYTEAVTLVAGGGSGILGVRDLKGKRVDIGPVGSGLRQNAIDALTVFLPKWSSKFSEIDSIISESAQRSDLNM